LFAAVDASVSPVDDVAPLIVAPARHVASDASSTLADTGLDDVVSEGSGRALLVALGVVLGVIFVVICVLGVTCTLQHCQRLPHAGQSLSLSADLPPPPRGHNSKRAVKVI